MAATNKQKRSPKNFRFGGKQHHGHSRAAYFAQAPLRIARNKAKRAAKQVRIQARLAKRRQRKEQE